VAWHEPSADTDLKRYPVNVYESGRQRNVVRDHEEDVNRICRVDINGTIFLRRKKDKAYR
jgi:hypothetical protein